MALNEMLGGMEEGALSNWGEVCVEGAIKFDTTGEWG